MPMASERREDRGLLRQLRSCETMFNAFSNCSAVVRLANSISPILIHRHYGNSASTRRSQSRQDVVYSTPQERCMKTTDLTYRRGFLGRALAAAAAGFVGLGTAEAQTEKKAASVPAAPATGPDAWIREVKGQHRCLFDFPQHKN